MRKHDPHLTTCKVRTPPSSLTYTYESTTPIPTECLHGIQRRLDGLGPIHPQRSALENVVKCTADAVDEELDTMIRTPADPAERDVLQKELKLMMQLLEKLTHYLETRRRRVRRANNMNASTSGVHQPSSSVPASQSA